eukprot:5139272-Amphidinium_carterae.1
MNAQLERALSNVRSRRFDPDLTRSGRWLSSPVIPPPANEEPAAISSCSSDEIDGTTQSFDEVEDIVIEDLRSGADDATSLTYAVNGVSFVIHGIRGLEAATTCCGRTNSESAFAARVAELQLPPEVLPCPIYSKHTRHREGIHSSELFKLV